MVASTISSQTMAMRRKRAKTPVQPMKTLAYPPSVGPKPSVNHWTTCTTIAATPSTSATTSISLARDALPPLWAARASQTSTAHPTAPTSTATPSPTDGSTPFGFHIPPLFRDRR